MFIGGSDGKGREMRTRAVDGEDQGRDQAVQRECMSPLPSVAGVDAPAASPAPIWGLEGRWVPCRGDCSAAREHDAGVEMSWRGKVGSALPGMSSLRDPASRWGPEASRTQSACGTHGNSSLDRSSPASPYGCVLPLSVGVRRALATAGPFLPRS